MPPRVRNKKFCTVCEEEFKDKKREKMNQARVGGVCASHKPKEAIEYCISCLEEEKDPPNQVKKAGLCGKHYKNSDQPCFICQRLYIENPNIVKGDEICPDHKDYKGLCIRCIQFKVENPQKVKGDELCLEHKGTIPPCKECVSSKTGRINNAKENGLCIFHGASKTMCSKCGLRWVQGKGMCKTCLGNDPSTICSTEDCNRKIRKEKLCKTCYLIKTGVLKQCGTENCDGYTYDDICKTCIYNIMIENAEIKDEDEFVDGKQLCYIKDCDTPKRAYGLCFKHFDEASKNFIYETQKIYEKRKYHSDINYRLARLLRKRMNELVSSDSKTDSSLKLLGCSMEYFKYYIESKFEKGMTWDNYGKWHIDHIKACANHVLSDPEEQRRCFSYKNMQPLWAKDNIAKGNR